MSREKFPYLRGEWDGGVCWELFESQELPPEELCTGVFVVPVMDDGKVLLVKPKKRGWGLIGGHIERQDDESREQALVREAGEEGGFIPDNPQPVAYVELTSKLPQPHQDGVRNYPYPVSYMAYYHSGIKENMFEPTGEDVETSGAFTFEEAQTLVSGIDLPVLELAYKVRMDIGPYA
jgi:ADP-ribose pyrophosphatase YjhB (NUDIX family)